MHGDIIEERDSSTTRIYFENVDGLSVDLCKPALNNNTKLSYFTHLLSRLQVDVVAGAEARTNWSMLPSTLTLPRLLNQREGSRCITAHNEHEKFSPRQQGGTFLAASPYLQDYRPAMGKDPSGLGRMCWIRLGGSQCAT